MPSRALVVARWGPRTLAKRPGAGDTRTMAARWVVGIDGSDAAVEALRWAVAHSAQHDARLTALGAFHVPAIMTVFSAKRGFGVDELGLEATAGHDVDTAIDAAGGVGVEASVVEGQPQHVLVDAAADADLLVLGRTGSGDLRLHLLGSVSRYCVTHSTVPVVVVPPDTASRSIGSIVVGFDGSEQSVDALRWALDFADDSTTVRVVSAIEVAPWVDLDLTRNVFGNEIDEEEQRIRAVLDAADPDGRAERSIVLSGPRDALAEAQADADLVVVGSRGRGLVAAGLIGSVSTWLLHEATVPVAVVPGR
jgi:nucleotide-binding universal stress UspA family protein